jgi:hypothetical protein
VLRAINLTAKAALIGLLLYAVARPELPQFADKAMEARLFTFGASAVVLPLVWLIARPSRPYPHGIDLCIVLPFLMDTLGNALDLYDDPAWFDDVMHFATWVPWVVAFGLLLITYAPPIPRWALFGCVLAFGAVTHIVWELLEYVTFIRGGPEEATAYRDTLGDLTMSLAGSLTGALLCVAITSRRPRPAPDPYGRAARRGRP